MRVLAIDTAGPVIGVALAVDGEVSARTERVTRGAEARLVPWATALCEEAGFRLSELDGIAVATGPGAFTGLRVGLATAVGLAQAIGCPVWQGDSLESRARAVGGDRVLSMLDARKQRVYAASYEAGARVAGPADIPPDEALGWMQAPFVATGEGALVYASMVREAGGELAPQADDPCVHVLARLGSQGLARGEGSDPLAVRPVYLRAPDARPPRGIGGRDGQ